MFETSATTEKLDDALAKVQGEIETAKKDSFNPHFKSKYADLASVWDAVRAALAKHNVSVTQWPVDSNDGRLHLVTRVAVKGEWMRATMSISVMKQDAQGFGSAISYARRYALSALLGVVADEDDDGNKASARPISAPVKNYAPKLAEVEDIDKALGQRPPATSPSSSSLRDYVIPAGKNKGKKLGDVSPRDLSSFVDWYNEESQKSNGAMNPVTTEFFNHAVDFLSEGQ